MNILDFLVGEALFVIPVLNIIGMIIKGFEKIPDRFIPLILLVFGVTGAIGLMGLSVNSVVQGVLITGASVYGNQLVKQLGEKKNDD